jgi:hypothetical protein
MGQDIVRATPGFRFPILQTLPNQQALGSRIIYFLRKWREFRNIVAREFLLRRENFAFRRDFTILRDYPGVFTIAFYKRLC